MKIKFIDFCSGIGAGRLGLEQAGMTCIAHSEINADADFTYNRFFNDKNNLGDLTQIVPEQLPDFDLMIAGFPCQTFSIVGQRRGFADDRGQIIYFLANILRAKKVPYFILENVKGLVNHNHGETIRTIISLLETSGYVVDFRVLNSSDFGVPQLRERVYFVGIRRDLYYRPFVFPSGIKSNKKISDFLLEDNSNELSISDITFQRYLHNKYNKNRVN
ncbi:MAG: DNA (cytosine-5-)-methyltransferase, partial [Alphaproteobacteria bacterium]